MMYCQGDGCEFWGAIGLNLTPVRDGQFQGKPKYIYLCKSCASVPRNSERKESIAEPQVYDQEYPF